MLIAEEPWIETSKDYYASHQLKYRMHSFLRRNHSGFKNVTFAIFKVSGSLISELRMKWKRKRVTPGVRRKLARLLRPGDVIITRHDDAASNLFLPGFWPHGALYIGTESQRQQIAAEQPIVEFGLTLPQIRSVCWKPARTAYCFGRYRTRSTLMPVRCCVRG